jgi:hypothetical protein
MEEIKAEKEQKVLDMERQIKAKLYGSKDRSTSMEVESPEIQSLFQKKEEEADRAYEYEAAF